MDPKQKSFVHRFAETVVKFPGLRIFWWIFTLGYKFPRIRKGENLGFCIAKNFIIFFIRFSYITAVIWYLRSWIAYISQGEQRPFNILERQVSQVNGTTAPILNLFSTAANQLRIDDVQHKDWNASSPLGYQVTHSMDAILLGQEMYTVQFDLDVLATGPYLKSVQVLFKHSLPLTTFGWTIASLLHPLGQQSYDMNSQYYFLPGHYVEIHYTPLQVNQISQTDNTTSLFQRFLVFMGYGERETYYTYQSTAMVTPFSPGSYDNVTTIIIIRPTSNIEILTTAEEKVSFRETLSNIGGLIGIVGSVIVFLFGASLMSPWGFIAEIPYFRNRISTSMSDAYKTKNGLFNGPFTTKVGQVGKFDNKLSVDERTILLKERIDELELILCEYYLNGAVFVAYSHPPVTMSPEPSTEGQTLPEQGQQPPPETEGQTPSEQGKQPPLKTEERRPLLGTEGQTPSKQE